MECNSWLLQVSAGERWPLKLLTCTWGWERQMDSGRGRGESAAQHGFPFMDPFPVQLTDLSCCLSACWQWLFPAGLCAHSCTNRNKRHSALRLFLRLLTWATPTRPGYGSYPKSKEQGWLRDLQPIADRHITATGVLDTHVEDLAPPLSLQLPTAENIMHRGRSQAQSTLTTASSIPKQSSPR